MIERVFIKKNFNKMELERYLSKKLERAGFSKLEIIKTPLVTRIVLHVAKPGLAIGKSGSTIKQLTEVIAEKHNIDNPQIEIQEIKNPNLNAKILAEKMASMIERGFAWRSVSYRTIKEIMDAGAQGIELVFKGKLAGKGGRKRKQRIAIGYMKKIGAQSAYVDTAKAAAYPKAGAIGIRLSIIHPEVIFPDKIDVNKVIEEIKKAREEVKEQLETLKKEAEKEGKSVKDETKTEGKETTKKAETPKTEKTEHKEVKTEKHTEHKKETRKAEHKTTEKKHEEGKETTKDKEEKGKKDESFIEKVAEKMEEVVEGIEEAAEKVVEKIEDTLEGKEEKKSEKKEVKKK